MSSQIVHASLSPSSQLAMKIAADRASNRAAAEISSLDVLVGIFRSHQDASEPLQLLEHAEVSPRQFSELCEKADRGFGPIGNLRPGTLSAQSASTTSFDSSAEASEILASAERLAREHIPVNQPEIRLRDLFGGLLLTENVASRLIRRALAETFVTLDQIRETYPDFLVWRTQPQQYKEFLAERHPAPRFPVSGFAADTTGDHDWIGIGPEVNAMAYLIAAKSLIPPLAIGLFGDWGSGKSFFMGALKRRINKITADAHNSHRPQREIDIYKYIVQIEFNAWHYVEGELWASLVEHILRNLQLGREGKNKETELQLRKKHWIEKLRKAHMEEAAIEELRKQLKDDLKNKTKEIEEAEQKAEAARRELAKLTEQDVWEVIKLTEDEEKQMGEVINAAGLGAVSKSTADMVAAFEQSHELLRRGNILLAPLRASGWRSILWVGAVMVVAFIGPLLSFALSKITEISALTDGFITIGGFASAAAGALATVNGWMRRWIKKAELAKTKLEERRTAGEQMFVEEVARLRTRQTEVLERLDQVKLEGEQKRREIRELEQELDGLTPGRVLLDFINERVGSEDYRKHLGVAALIRRDFEKLSELIKDSNKSFVESDSGEPTPEDEHRINRIVLYIDDLDRCPPGKVIEVLQAVHLLMAFPLFVVIVAVDSRWLSQSLRSHYGKLLSDLRAATAHDYLEKIFQIPFWIRPLPENARLRIVHELIGESLVRRDQGNGYVEPAEGKGLVKWDASEPERPLKPDTPTELRPRSLEILEEELKFMESLRALLGQSPRAVKRFVNVYRLIKASASGRAADFVSDRPDADFKLVLFLLAVVTGLSSISALFFQALIRADEPTLGGLVASLNKDLDSKARAAAELSRLNAWLEDPKASAWKELEVARLAVWVRQVARFSYRIELV
jgi:hypothetical protein